VTARLTLRVAPGAASTAVVGRYGDGWKLRVAAAPENGKANAAVLRLLAEVLDVPERDVAIVSGHGSRDKTVVLTGIGDDEIERRLTGACVARP
jgi:uncharacterized protein (TIGR00251 family)